MKPHFVPHMLLRAGLGVVFLASNAIAHPGHPGHDGAATSAAAIPEVGPVSLAFVVACLALFVTRGITRRLP